VYSQKEVAQVLAQLRLRAMHVIVKVQGRPVEIQVRTRLF